MATEGIKYPVRVGRRALNIVDDDGVLIATAVELFERDEIIAALNGHGELKAKIIAYISDVKNGVSSKAFNDLMRILGALDGD